MIRNGLAYRLTRDYCDDLVQVYGPEYPFTVDEVFYAVDPMRYCHRPMIELFDPLDDHLFDASVQYHSRPPTEAELSRWVRGEWVQGLP